MAKKAIAAKKRVVKIEGVGQLHVMSSFNNVIVTCCKVAYDLGLRKVKAYVKGPGQGRESAIRACVAAGIDVTEIVDVTPMPHNGCRPPKRRRV